MKQTLLKILAEHDIVSKALGEFAQNYVISINNDERKKTDYCCEQFVDGVCHHDPVVYRGYMRLYHALKHAPIYRMEHDEKIKKHNYSLLKK